MSDYSNVLVVAKERIKLKEQHYLNVKAAQNKKTKELAELADLLLDGRTKAAKAAKEREAMST